jgi:hypothetical protein
MFIDSLNTINVGDLNNSNKIESLLIDLHDLRIIKFGQLDMGHNLISVLISEPFKSRLSQPVFKMLMAHAIRFRDVRRKEPIRFHERFAHKFPQCSTFMMGLMIFLLGEYR